MNSKHVKAIEEAFAKEFPEHDGRFDEPFTITCRECLKCWNVCTPLTPAPGQAAA